jgi:hypothetical protein
MRLNGLHSRRSRDSDGNSKKSDCFINCENAIIDLKASTLPADPPILRDKEVHGVSVKCCNQLFVDPVVAAMLGIA